jgi:hypothetical protein
VYVHNVEERAGQGRHANGDGNGSIESVNNAEHDAEPESFAESDCESESGGESGTESEPERKPNAGTESIAE